MISSADQLKALIRNLSNGNSADSQLLMRIYMMERFLERISLSEHKDKFILKGGLLIASMIGVNARSTMDLDTTVKGASVTIVDIKDLITDVISTPLNDGVSFRIKKITEIMEDSDYHGVRVNMDATFDGVISPLKIDVSTGDAITPKEVSHKINLMFEKRTIDVWSYNLETVISEKLETLISRSIANTRMRDFYDLYILNKIYADHIDYDILSKAIRATARKRKTLQLIESDDINDILDEIESNTTMQELWRKYQKNYKYANGITWSNAMMAVRDLYNSTRHSN